MLHRFIVPLLRQQSNDGVAPPRGNFYPMWQPQTEWRWVGVHSIAHLAPLPTSAAVRVPRR
jgi:hypothetical protein